MALAPRERPLDTPAQQRTEYRRAIDAAYQRADEVGQAQRREQPLNRAAAAVGGALSGAASWARSGAQDRPMPMGRTSQSGPTPTPRASSQTGSGLRDAYTRADQWVTRNVTQPLGIAPGFAFTPPRNEAPGQRAAPSQLSPDAVSAAEQVGSVRSTGYYTNPQGQRTYVPGTTRAPEAVSGVSGISVMGNMRAAGEEFARANAIRQEMIDAQRPSQQVTVIGQQGGRGANPDQLFAQAQRLREQAGRASNTRRNASLTGQARALERQAGAVVGQADGAADRQTQLQLQQMRNQGALDTTIAGLPSGAPSGTDIYNLARAQNQLMMNERLSRGLPAERPVVDENQVNALQAAGDEAGVQRYVQAIQAMQDVYDLDNMLSSIGATEQDAYESFMSGELDENSYLYSVLSRMYGEPQRFADGGMVEAPGAMSAAMGPNMDFGSAAMMGAPSSMYDPVQVEYDEYAKGAQRLGLPAVPFEEFVNLKQQAVPQAPAAPAQSQPMAAMGFNQGGPVPDLSAMGQMNDVSGKMVVDPDPNAATDSIPAMIDGQHPAALDSGEFVIPEDVVRFFGTQKFMQMIKQAQQGNSNGAESGPAAAGA